MISFRSILAYFGARSNFMCRRRRHLLPKPKLNRQAQRAETAFCREDEQTGGTGSGLGFKGFRVWGFRVEGCSSPPVHAPHSISTLALKYLYRHPLRAKVHTMQVHRPIISGLRLVVLFRAHGFPITRNPKP